LPRVDDGFGQMRALPIKKDEGLTETVHVMFFPDHIVATDFNFYGPRSTRLKDYLHKKVPKQIRGTEFELASLFRNEPAKQLARLESVRILNLKVKRSYLAEIKNFDVGLYTALDTVAKLGEADVIEIRMQSSRKKESALGKTIAKIVGKLTKNEVLAGFEKAQIGGFDSEIQKNATLDLLADRVVSKKDMVLIDERTRAVDPISAFVAIREAYNELKADLSVASTVSI
jgi:hypothetical protein